MKIDEMISKWSMRLVEKDGQIGVMVRDKVTEKQATMIKKAKPEIVAELQRREKEQAEREAKRQAERESERQAILNGEKPVQIAFWNGEYLSDWAVIGESVDLMKELGLASYVSGWGCCLNHGVIEALGKEFTYQQAVEYARPAQEARAAEKARKAAARKTKFDEARKTGKPVLLNQWMSECHDPNEECSCDSNYEYAMPDGTVKYEWHHTW